MLGLQLHHLNDFFIFFVFLILLRSLMELFENYIITVQGEKFVKTLREKAFHTQMGWTEGQFKEKYFGKYLLRYSNDMKAIQNYLTKGLFGGLRDIIFLIMGFILLSLLNFPLSVLYFSLTFIFMIIVLIVASKQKSLIENSRTERSVLLSMVSKSFQRHHKIKAASNEEQTLDKFDLQSQKLFDANRKNHLFESMLLGFYSVMQYGLILTVLLFISMNKYIHIHKGDALVFLLIMMLLNAPLKRILKVPTTINKGLVSFNKIENIFKATPAEVVS